MNFHFTTTKAHILRLGGKVVEVPRDDALKAESDCLFKGNFDLNKLESTVQKVGKENVSFVRIEAGTNLIGGQPISLENMRKVSDFCHKQGIILVFDASLLADNLFFIKTREEECKNRPISDIVREIASLMDVIYFSGRKLGCARGGGIMTFREDLFNSMRSFVTLFEGFLTYGGMSVREMEAMAVGIKETLDMHVISQTPLFVEALGKMLKSNGVPVVTPFGGLGCHIDAMRFVDHIPQNQYPAGALTAAAYIVGGIRGMERGTLSEERNPDGSDHFASMELLRLAVPKRVFTFSQLKFVADRLSWLYKNRQLIQGLEFEEEPPILRFFFGRLRPINNWHKNLAAKFIADMPSGI